MGSTAGDGRTARYDVFVSYRQTEPDQGWVRDRLVPGLDDDGLRVCVDFRDFRPGVPVLAEMSRAVEASTYTIAVMTPRYLDSTFTELEAVMAGHLGLERAQWMLIPVMRERVRPPLHLRSLLWIDMTDDDRFAGTIRDLRHVLSSPPAAARW